MTDSQFDPLRGVASGDLPSVMGAALNYQAGTRLDWHRHDVGQLVYAISGTMKVETREAIHIIPPLMATWVGPQVEHAVTMRNDVSMRTLYFQEDAAPLTHSRCCVLRVSPLLRELILSLIEEGKTQPANPVRRAALCTLVADELGHMAPEPLALPSPKDPRVTLIIEILSADPGDDRPLAEWPKTVGASLRTIERIFLRETGMTLGQWRRQARLLSAVSALAEGKPITQVALDAGYGSSSAFTFMFRRALGATPSDFFKSLDRVRLP